MLALSKLSFILLLCVLSAQADDPTPKQCTTALFHGISTVMFSGADKIRSLMRQGKIGQYEFDPTCELVEIALTTITDEFYETGCGWGMASGAFEARVMTLLKDIFTGECPFFDRFTAADVSIVQVSFLADAQASPCFICH